MKFKLSLEPCREVIKHFMLNSAKLETLHVYKYKNIKKFSIFKAQISIECFFPDQMS